MQKVARIQIYNVLLQANIANKCTILQPAINARLN